MKEHLKREDDFEERRKHLKNLSDEELKEKFWELAGEIVDPLFDLAQTHTTPSIERSVLLRMGFSSLEVDPLVKACIQNGLIQHGAGHVVYKLAQMKDLSIRDAGLLLLEGKHWDDVIAAFGGGL